MRSIVEKLGMWLFLIVLLLLIPLVLTLSNPSAYVNGGEGGGWDWSAFDFLLMGVALFGTALVYELMAQKSKAKLYKVAWGIGLIGVLLLFWVNGAVGIIGSENQSVNLLYVAVPFAGLVGTLLARSRPKGMSRTLFVMALIQIVIPAVALIISPPPDTSWSPSVLRVFILSGFFAMLFITSGVLFQRANKQK